MAGRRWWARWRRRPGAPVRVQAPPGLAGTREDLDRLAVGGLAVARWALLPAHPLLLAALVRRRGRVPAGVLAAVQVGLGVAALGRGRPDPAVPGAVPLRLVTANLLHVNRTVADVGRVLAAHRPDVLCLQELTPTHLETLRGTGLLDALPHVQADPRRGYHGSAVLSRWPLAGEVLDVGRHPVAAADLATPAGTVRVLSVHVVNPVSRSAGAPGTWRAQLDALRRIAADGLAAGVPVVLAGDWNATLDHAPLRRVLAAGLRDAWVVAGRGPGLSWPAWPRVPPLMRIDHVLVGGGLRVRGARTLPTPGSDHHHVVVDLEL